MSSERPCRPWASRREALLLAALLLLPGCARLRPPPPSGPTGPTTEGGSREDAVLHLPMRAAGTPERISFVGDRWQVTVDGNAGWRREADPTSTLMLVRKAEGVRVALRLRAYAVREGMAPKTFLAAHAMWVAEEGGPRIEYTWDKDLQAWQGYAVDRDRETYYVFRVVGDRAYVLEASAEEGSLSARAADEFQRIAADFECRPRPGQAAPSPSPETQPETP